MAESVGTATVTVTPEFSKDFEEMIREIVRDEINSVIAEKTTTAGKALFGALTKAAATALTKGQQHVDNSVTVKSTAINSAQEFAEALKAKRDREAHAVHRN